MIGANVERQDGLDVQHILLIALRSGPEIQIVLKRERYDFGDWILDEVRELGSLFRVSVRGRERYCSNSGDTYAGPEPTLRSLHSISGMGFAPYRAERDSARRSFQPS